MERFSGGGISWQYGDVQNAALYKEGPINRSSAHAQKEVVIAGVPTAIPARFYIGVANAELLQVQ